MLTGKLDGKCCRLSEGGGEVGRGGSGQEKEGRGEEGGGEEGGREANVVSSSVLMTETEASGVGEEGKIVGAEDNTLVEVADSGYRPGRCRSTACSALNLDSREGREVAITS